MTTEAAPPAFDQVAAAVMPAGLGSTLFYKQLDGQKVRHVWYVADVYIYIYIYNMIYRNTYLIMYLYRPVSFLLHPQGNSWPMRFRKPNQKFLRRHHTQWIQKVDLKILSFNFLAGLENSGAFAPPAELNT